MGKSPKNPMKPPYFPMIFVWFSHCFSQTNIEKQQGNRGVFLTPRPRQSPEPLPLVRMDRILKWSYFTLYMAMNPCGFDITFLGNPLLDEEIIDPNGPNPQYD